MMCSRLVARVSRHFESLDHSKGHLLGPSGPGAGLMGDVVDHPLSDEELRQLRQSKRRKRQPATHASRQSDRLDPGSLGQRERGRASPAVFGYSDSKRSLLNLLMTSRTRSELVNVTLAILATSMPWTDNKIIWARRHVTTPDERRTTHTSRFPSSLETSRTRKSSRDTPTLPIRPVTNVMEIVLDQPIQVVDLHGKCLRTPGWLRDGARRCSRARRRWVRSCRACCWLPEFGSTSPSRP
ncbi:MAG: hypothetical protein QOJ52_1804 [Acidimicrobiaceae bacterium]|nr:hypothetical protein [Acidimicrobiaceae bacterium]